MATETAAVRTLGRRVKTHILTRYLYLADMVDKDTIQSLSEDEKKEYHSLTDKFAPNCIAKSVEMSGEEGEAIKLSFDKAFDNGASRETTEGSGIESPLQDNQSRT